MLNSLQITQHIDITTPLGALIAHYNASSKSVKKAFAKLMLNSLEQEEKTKLQAKVKSGAMVIKDGKGIYRKEKETTEQFFERLCTE